MSSESTGENSIKTISEHLPPLEIDVEHWRREIQMFVETTVQELNAINDQLSSCFATQSTTPPSTSPAGRLSSENVTEESATNLAKQNLGAFKATQTDDRLAQLRQKLASKITSSNSVETSS